MTATEDARVQIPEQELRKWGFCVTTTRMSSFMLDQITDPMPGSLLAADDAAYRWEKCSAWNKTYLRAATEHMLMWANTVSSPRGGEEVPLIHMPRPFFTLARAGLEAAAQAVWTLQEDDPAERVHRHLRLVYHDLRQNALALEAAHDGRSRHARKRMTDLLERISETYDSVTIRKDEPKYSMMVKDSAVFAGYEPNVLEVLWRGASAAAHGKNWFLQMAYDTTPGDEFEPGYFRSTMVPDSAQITNAVEAASSMISAGVLRFAALSGYDQTALMTTAAARLRDEKQDARPRPEVPAE